MTLTTSFIFSAFSGTSWLALVAIGIGLTVGMLEHFAAPPESSIKERVRLAFFYGTGWGAICGVVTILALGNASSYPFTPAGLLGAASIWGILSAASAVASLKVFCRASRRSTRFNCSKCGANRCFR